MAEGRREPICEYYSGGRKRIQHNTNTLHVLFVPMKIHAVRADEQEPHAAALVGNEDDPFVDTTDTGYSLLYRGRFLAFIKRLHILLSYIFVMQNLPHQIFL